MSDEKISAKIHFFDGLHYDQWSELVKNLPCAKELQDLENTRTKDHKVKHYLFQAIDKSIFEQVLDRHTSKIVRDSLKKKFGGNNCVKKALLNSLRREFEVLEMKEVETIIEYFARVMAMANKMWSNGCQTQRWCKKFFEH
uniref:Retrovirus-related Pol polyprotein from transposon TNT 1-94 n=1 Tax=Cajanus cajan TaxID=3821 RepID=A0A151RY26_CAJCA|nr:hypothetical protein KK1_030981 [Cajanus cajan]